MDRTAQKHVDFVLKVSSVIPKMAPVKMDVRMVTSVICAQKVIIRIFFLLSHGKHSVSSNMTINRITVKRGNTSI